MKIRRMFFEKSLPFEEFFSIAFGFSAMQKYDREVCENAIGDVIYQKCSRRAGFKKPYVALEQFTGLAFQCDLRTRGVRLFSDQEKIYLRL